MNVEFYENVTSKIKKSVSKKTTYSKANETHPMHKSISAGVAFSLIAIAVGIVLFLVFRSGAFNNTTEVRSKAAGDPVMLCSTCWKYVKNSTTSTCKQTKCVQKENAGGNTVEMCYCKMVPGDGSADAGTNGGYQVSSGDKVKTDNYNPDGTTPTKSADC